MKLSIENLIEFLSETFDGCICDYNNWDEVMCDSQSEEWFKENCDLKCGAKCWIKFLKNKGVMEECDGNEKV